jgi:hypothetical protein
MSNSKQYKSNSSNLLRVRQMTAAFTPIQADSGTHFILDADGKAITLGLATAFEIGTWFRFVVGETLSASWTLTAAGDTLLHGRIQGGGTNDAAAGTTAGTGEDVITFVTGQAEEGDYVEMFTDGVNWYIQGHCELAANITVTAP